MQNIKEYIAKHQNRFIEEVLELLKIPSISADAAYKDDVIKTSEAMWIFW